MPLASVALPGSLSASILRSAFLPQDHKQEPAGHGASETVTQTCFFQGSLLSSSHSNGKLTFQDGNRMSYTF